MDGKPGFSQKQTRNKPAGKWLLFPVLLWLIVATNSSGNSEEYLLGPGVYCK